MARGAAAPLGGRKAGPAGHCRPGPGGRVAGLGSGKRQLLKLALVTKEWVRGRQEDTNVQPAGTEQLLGGGAGRGRGAGVCLSNELVRGKVCRIVFRPRF